MSGAGLPDIEIPDAEGMSVAIVTAHWNKDITGELRAQAIAAAEEAGAYVRDYTVVGALELPVVVQALADDHDAVVALGCVIRGGTPHFDYVCSAATDGLTRVSVDTGVPVGFGVLTCDDEQQALDRAGLPESTEDKGHEAATAAVATVVALQSALSRGSVQA